MCGACCRSLATSSPAPGSACRTSTASRTPKGPGLAGALLVGAAVASGLACALGKPALGVHHLEGHLLSPLLAEPKPAFPFVALLVSGGHSQIFEVAGVGRYALLGDTLDDAAGEAFDKTAKLLGLPYPGGPAVAELASRGVPGAVDLPRPMIDSGDLAMSFSGLKTAVITVARRAPLTPQRKADIAHAFQAAVVDVLTAKALAALRNTGHRRLVVAGGVGANRALRARLVGDAARLRCAGVLSRPRVLHGQRRDDRARRCAAPADRHGTLRVRLRRATALGARVAGGAQAQRPIVRSLPVKSCRMLARWRQKSSRAIGTIAHAMSALPNT